uniref:helix-turn-helix transcriptional regulator n=1 Tax=Pantoea ananas TaxID=553 RepID=UPI0021AA218A|nr:AraC family transcriptional regulator [Pantoea ananatis]
MLVIQVLRLHADDSATPRTGWLFALRDKKLSAAIACMHDAPGQGWTVETLATQVGMSRSAFAQHFSQTVGMAPAACLTQWRMLLACDRLQQTDDSVLHIATSLGYESESAFRKAFKRVIGCTPGKFPAG